MNKSQNNLNENYINYCLSMFTEDPVDKKIQENERG